MMDLRVRLPESMRQALAAYPRLLCWSSHTTAGFLDGPWLPAWRRTEEPGLTGYVETSGRVFPEGGGLRARPPGTPDRARRVAAAVEPKNADSHLAFIAAGLRTCVT